MSLAALSGCARNGSGSGTLPSGTPSVSGNWDFVPVDTASIPSNGITHMSGVIKQEGSSTFVSSVLRLNSPCYSDAIVVPFVGSVSTTQVQMGSYDVKDQTVTVTAVKNSTATSLSTKVSISGGCASGVNQQFTGTVYSALTGTYTGTFSGSQQQMTLRVSQDGNGTGSGTFVLSPGSAASTVTNLSCFTSGAVDNITSTISGQNVVLSLVQSDGAQFLLIGTLSTDGKTLTVSTPVLSGGTCSGPNLGSITLTQSAQ